ncbi:MAG TPA: hypothetical protein VGM92_12835, partial [Candidatus Kapabacteria bacterium]
MITSLLASILFSHSLMIAQPVSNGNTLVSSPVLTVPMPTVDTPMMDTSMEDDTSSTMMMNDTMQFDAMHGFSMRSHRKHHFVVTELPNARQIPYMEPFTFIDFNRVTGFFLGLGTPGQIDFGHHDQFGIDGGTGYGFASKRWEYRMNGEFRFPLGERK